MKSYIKEDNQIHQYINKVLNVCTREILIDSAYGNYYLKVFLEKYNFNDDIKIYSDDSYHLDSNEEYPDDFDVKIPMKKIQIHF